MTYATQSDLVDRFGDTELIQRTNRTGGNTIDAVVLGRALADADAEIDGYLAARYQLPIATPPALLVRLAADIARYHLYDDGLPDTVSKRYTDAVALLKRLATGEVQLVGAASVVVAPNTAEIPVLSRSQPRQFGPEQLAGY
ncbi:MAG: DUF1320 domain-containing protein [Curvibacter lanceolatus]|uniref:gp436 family protein n=1 Tax=Curvibacter lanceolatus TaxID=86182 RepID=UPI002352964F|nr:DUF1320 domain-containing protein [Curvibacter lanceolatus]MBV5296294.1 DUF1320 domain-containing protein [Curvibacter lanceolatus]